MLFFLHFLFMKNTIKEFKEKGLSEIDIKIISDKVGDDLAKFRRLAQRRLFKEPFAYIFNKTHFFGHSLFIDRRVYVPNPETEEMVKIFLGLAKNKSTVVDVGCGSGAIGISIKLKMKNFHVHATDIDPSALEVAKINAKNLNADIDFHESFYLDDIDIANPEYLISDLPYGNASYTLPSIDIREFTHMPPVSLFHPKGELSAYQELIASIIRKKWKTTLIFETGRVEKEKVAKIIPNGLKWEYIQKDNYSVTVLHFS